MAFPFDVDDTIIPVMIEIEGPILRRTLRFALDTAATQTAVSTKELVNMGFPEPDENSGGVKLVTGSSTVYVTEFVLPRITALGHHFADFPVLGVPIPPDATFDGVLGKDFFRLKVLTIDFRNGLIDLQ